MAIIKAPWIEMIANRIEVLMHGTEFENKYPGGIHVVHMQTKTRPDVEFTFSHNGTEISDTVEKAKLTNAFYQLMGEDDGPEFDSAGYNVIDR